MRAYTISFGAPFQGSKTEQKATGGGEQAKCSRGGGHLWGPGLSARVESTAGVTTEPGVLQDPPPSYNWGVLATPQLSSPNLTLGKVVLSFGSHTQLFFALDPSAAA